MHPVMTTHDEAPQGAKPATQHRWIEPLVARTHGGDAGLVRALADEVRAALAGDEPTVRLRRMALTQSDDAVLVARAPFARWFALGEVARAAGSGALESVGDGERVVACGPPWGYLRSGLDPHDAELCAAWRARGFGEETSHVDLVVRPRGGGGGATSAGRWIVERAEGAAVGGAVAWVRETFDYAWSVEAARGAARGGLFVARERASGSIVGFCAHSGHNAAAGTFGPLGVHTSARGRGLGAALAARALGDLAARGFERVTIPWVDRALVEFYGAITDEQRVVERIIVRKGAR
jgi:ribosomal protein S18 acetylase RimI-like enzyme